VGFVTSIMTDTRDNHLDERGEGPFTDIHCHCLPGLDDGPATVLESLELCRMLAREGIAVVVATPHQLGRFHGCNEATTVREVVCCLNESLRDSDIPLKVVPGGEVRVDERICRLLAADKVLTLADNGRYILIELPHSVFIDIEPLLVELLSTSIQPIISHAERIAPLVAHPEILFRWLDRSTHLQITASSLLGELGPAIQRAAWGFLSSGVAALVATDAHNAESRKPRMRAAFERISTELGRDLAHRVCIENPSRVVNGQAILPVLPCQHQGAG